MIETNRPAERAILIGINYPAQDEKETEDFLNELSFLAETAGAQPVRRFIQKLAMPDPRTFLGSGKTEEVAQFVSENDIDIAVKGIKPELFFKFYAYLYKHLSKPVDLVDLSRISLFNNLIEETGIKIYG